MRYCNGRIFSTYMAHFIKDIDGSNIGVFIPIEEWKALVARHNDLNALVSIESSGKKKLSDFIGMLSDETATDMLRYVEDSRNEWR